MIPTEILRRFDFLGEVGSDRLESIAAISTEAVFESGDVIFREGDVADHVYLVQDGEVDLTVLAGSGERRVVDTIVGSELLGWSAFVAPHVFHFDGMARTGAKLVVTDSVKLRDMMEQDHQLGFRIMTGVTEAMRHRLEGARVQIAANSS